MTWWTVVPKDDEFEEIDPSSLGGSYVFVERTDVVEAIADFVAMYLVQVRRLCFRSETLQVC